MIDPVLNPMKVATAIVIAIVASYDARSLAALVGVSSRRAKLAWFIGCGIATALGMAEVRLVTLLGQLIVLGAIAFVLLERRSRRAARDTALTNAHYREIAEAMPQIVWTARGDGRLDYLNRRFAEYTGLLTVEKTVAHWGEVVHPDDLANTLASWGTAVQTSEPLVIEYRLRRASDGEYRWHLSRAEPLRDANGLVIKWFGTCTDIHEQKHAENFLRAQQVTLEHAIVEREAEAERATALYQLLAENATDMVSTHRTDGTFDYATPSWIEYLGTEPANQAPAMASHPDDVPLLMTNYKAAFKSFEPITTIWRCRRADGSYGWLETRTRAVRHPGTNRVVTFVCATRDITKMKLDELALRESEAKYRQLVEQAADAILLVEVDGRCAAANTRAGQLAGVAPADLVGRAVASFMVAAEAEGEGSSDAPIVSAEYLFLRNDGSRVPVEVSAAALSDGRVQIIARDISGRKELERLKDEFVSVVSHELRTPLTSIRGSLGLLASGQLASTPEKGQRMLSVAVANTDRLIRLINDILDVERIDSGAATMEPAWCDGLEIANSVIEAMRPMADRSGVLLAVRGGGVRLWIDTDRITQTLTNLVGNAIKFSPSGSTVEIVLTPGLDGAQFEVRDQGRGIPAEKLETIFERFQQVDASDSRAKGGTGLGLAICRGIVREHGGRIWAENNPGGGSVFRFTLPRALHTDRSDNAASPAPESGGKKNGRVLVIEDDIELSQVIAMALEARGFEVDVAHSGAAAVERQRLSRADMLIVDLNLPDTKGLDLVERLRGGLGASGTRTIIYTASDLESADRERIRGMGAELATKSRVSTEALVERVIRAIETVSFHPLQVA